MTPRSFVCSPFTIRAGRHAHLGFDPEARSPYPRVLWPSPASDSHATSLSASAVRQNSQKKKRHLVGGRSCSVGSSTRSPVHTAVHIPNDRHRPARPVVTTASQPLNLSTSVRKPPRVLKRTSGGHPLTFSWPALPAPQDNKARYQLQQR